MKELIRLPKTCHLFPVRFFQNEYLINLFEMEEGSVTRVINDFHAVNECELLLKKGDVVQVLFMQFVIDCCH